MASAPASPKTFSSWTFLDPQMFFSIEYSVKYVVLYKAQEERKITIGHWFSFYNVPHTILSWNRKIPKTWCFLVAYLYIYCTNYVQSSSNVMSTIFLVMIFISVCVVLQRLCSAWNALMYVCNNCLLLSGTHCCLHGVFVLLIDWLIDWLNLINVPV